MGQIANLTSGLVARTTPLAIPEIAKLTEKPVGKIVLSHEHFDHTGGTEVFQGAEIIAQENVNGVSDLDPLGMFPDKVDQTFETELDIDMGGSVAKIF